MDPITIVVTLFLIAGIVASLVPMLPGGLVSLTGVGIYFFGSNNPSTFFMIFGIITAVFTLIVDWFAGSIAARYGGASNKTSIAAGIAGLIGFIITLGNPIGLLAGVTISVFAREYLIHGDRKQGAKAAFYATIGVLGSSIIQALLTASILIAFILTLLL